MVCVSIVRSHHHIESVGMYPQKVNVPFWQVVSHMIFASMVVIGNTYYALLSFYLQTVHSRVCG